MLMTDELMIYLGNVHREIIQRGNPGSIPTTSTCPECGANFNSRTDAMNDLDGAHLVLELSGDVFAVVVGCEGYWVINPAMVGLGAEHPNWMGV